MPLIGFHSVILKPDSVKRVTPPTTITANTSPEESISQRPTLGGDKVGRDPAVVEADRRAW